MPLRLPIVAALVLPRRESAKKKDVRLMNIEAAKAVADAIRTSLGPRGMDKMVRRRRRHRKRGWRPAPAAAGRHIDGQTYKQAISTGRRQPNERTLAFCWGMARPAPLATRN